VLGGLAAGTLWTAQGVYYARFAAAHAEASGQLVEAVNARFAGQFAMWFLGAEGAFKLLNTLTSSRDDARTALAAIYTVLAVLTAALASASTPTIPDSRAERDTSSSGRGSGGGSGGGSAGNCLSLETLTAVFTLWRDDARILLLVPFTVACSLAFTLLDSTVATEVTTPLLGATSLNLLTFVLVAVGVLLARASARMPHRKVNFVAVAAIASLAAGVTIASIYDAGQGTEPQHTAWASLLLYYGLMGVVRGVLESAYTALVADWFPTRRCAAFANLVLFRGISSAPAALLLPMAWSGDGEVHLVVTLVGIACIILLSTLAWPSVLVASQLTQSRPIKPKMADVCLHNTAAAGAA